MNCVERSTVCSSIFITKASRSDRDVIDSMSDF